MHFLAYIIVYPILWLISILPFRLLYLISDGVYILLYHIIGYRKKVVTENLKLVFPDKPEDEILAIRKKFYKHLCDMFLEMAKTMSISKASLEKRFVLKNPEAINRFEEVNKSVLLMYGHYASWEWSSQLQNLTDFPGFAVYKKLANKYFDKMVRDIRSKFNTSLISTRETVGAITQSERNGVKSVIAFLSDQSPRLSKEVYWNEFMGIEVPCFTGAERLAKKLDLAIAYLKITKVKRGHYEAEIMMLSENPKESPDYELTDMFLREVEKQIYEAPEFYFWTHKRWKHRNKKAE
ncbi:lysophospholipid acyltransferase family protein [Tamlana sp. 2_MG-2023]|uniref:lysophospholipid acyltransferase family protein n=1 Tax=unclassified Tamlana TaxID=2614803 RepID=UPI0026E3CE91|nr:MULTISPECIES: lysophospholipid acyltransferase family protein [unclassified Tamlana]MDO6759590.1 lysophospholipid acyltransferase family protein [Tamlana sp. 2_MG-2023]MDO6792183.1 lysophospholipid acyltransferase family protein [Tamlana sp. 1_MG-2023]